MWLLILISCRPAISPESAPPSGEGWEDVTLLSHLAPETGDGFGSSLATGPQLLVGAPNTPHGRLYTVNSDGPSLLFEEPTAGAGGTAVAWATTGEALMGAPLANGAQGVVYADGVIWKEGGRVLGSRILVREEVVLIAESAAVWFGEELLEMPHRIGGLALWGGTPVAGHPFGDLALSGAGISLTRAQAQDQAGYAICTANFDDDPEDEIALGAPGAGRVYVVNPGEDLASAWSIELNEGRFGHALACRDHLIAIGAPTAGTDLSGAVWCLSGNHDTWTLEQPTLQGEPWQQLGFAVALGPRELAAGGPGSADVPGIVQQAKW
jgi:hypothetical protein